MRNSVITAQSRIYSAVNTAMVQAYWEIGEQMYLACGENDRAEYGAGLLKYLSEQLTAEFGKGYTVRNLQMMRKFYLMYQNTNTLCSQLSWSHYRVLMRISDEKRRKWYTDECAKSGWSVRQLERQINTMFYERLLSSKDKESVAAEIQTTEPKPEYEKIIRDPYVLEFLDLPANPHFYEKDLGQMQMYVNYYTRELMNEGDNPPIGIVLCADKSDAIVKYTLPEDNKQIFASRYMTCIPSEEEFKRELRLEEYKKIDEQ